MESTEALSEQTYSVPPVHATPTSPEGSLIIIGGHENKEGHRPILKEIASRVRNGKLVVATIASEKPEEQWATYREVFHELGVTNVEQLDVRKREELLQNPRLELLDGAEVLFFAGGDQTKITSRLGGTPLCTRMREIYEAGTTIAGTSSGASVMSEVMMTGGDENTSNGESGTSLGAGLGLIPSVIIDQHFAQRGRISRLLQAVAQNPRLLGLGIDEDTAIVVNEHRDFRVLGSGAVYVVDGTSMTFTKIAEEGDGASSMFGIYVHVLGEGDVFDLDSRTPHAAQDS